MVNYQKVNQYCEPPKNQPVHEVTQNAKWPKELFDLLPSDTLNLLFKNL